MVSNQNIKQLLDDIEGDYFFEEFYSKEIKDWLKKRAAKKDVLIWANAPSRMKTLL